MNRVHADGLLHDRLPHHSNGRIARGIRTGDIKAPVTDAVRVIPYLDWVRHRAGAVKESLTTADAQAPDPGAELARHMPRQLEGDAPTEGIGSD